MDLRIKLSHFFLTFDIYNKRVKNLCENYYESGKQITKLKSTTEYPMIF